MGDSYANFTIRGIESGAEVGPIEDALQDLDGVQMVTIDPESGETEVRYGEELLSAERIRSTVRDAGYEVD